MPPLYDKRIFKGVYKTIEYGILLHLTVAIWLFSDPTYFNVEIYQKNFFGFHTILYYPLFFIEAVIQSPKLLPLTFLWELIGTYIIFK